MSYVSRKDIQKAKELDLLTYLRNYKPHELVRVSGETYCTREHDSLKISNGMWNWFSRGIGGRTALDYLIIVQGYTLPDAVDRILKSPPERPSDMHGPPQQQERRLILPEVNDTADKVMKYLMRRGIDREVIDHCISHRLLFETKRYHNAMFIGYDRTGKARYAALRGTKGYYKGEATGSNKHYSFLIAGSPCADNVHVFESAIDALSYASLLKMAGRDWRQEPLLSLAGVFQTKRKYVVPMALDRFLRDWPEINTVILHLDNDEVGRGAAEGILGGLGDRYQVLDRPPTDGKDVNDYLVGKIARRKRKEKV